MRRKQSDRSVSRLASRHRAAILSDIIINENLKLLQINYLARKVDVLIYLLGHIVLATELWKSIVCVRVCVYNVYIDTHTHI